MTEEAETDGGFVIEWFFFGYDGKMLTRQEYEKRLAEVSEAEDRGKLAYSLWRLSHPEYDDEPWESQYGW